MSAKLLILLLVLTLGLMTAGCSGGAGGGTTTPPPQTTFTVTGTVIDSITGAAVSGWTVRLTGTGATAPGGNGGLTAAATSDSNGNINETVSDALTGPGTVTVSNGSTVGYGPVAVTMPAAGGTLALGQLSVNSNGLPPPPPI